MPHFQQQTGRGEGPFCIEEWGPPPSPTAFSRPQRRRAARPDWWGSRTSPSSTQRAQQSANESPPPAPKPEQTPGGAPRMAKANARWPPAAVERCRRSSLGCQSVAACGEGSGGVRFVLASGGRAKGSGGEREQTADSAKCGLLVSHLLLVSPSHGRRFPGRSPSPAPRPSPRPSSSSLPPLRPLRRSRRAGSWPDARDAGADLLRALRPGPPPLLPPVLPVVLAGERVPFAGLSPERVSPRPSSDLFCGLRAALRCASRGAPQHSPCKWGNG